MEQISQIHYAEHFPFSFHSSVNGVSFDKIFTKYDRQEHARSFLYPYFRSIRLQVSCMRNSHIDAGQLPFQRHHHQALPEIARRYGINPDSIELSIRTVISAIWYDRDPALLRDFMGRSYQFQPGNAKFIGIASRRFSLYLRAAMRSRKEKPEKVRLYRAFQYGVPGAIRTRGLSLRRSPRRFLPHYL